MLKTLTVKGLCVMKRNNDFWIARQIPICDKYPAFILRCFNIVLTLERNVFTALIFRNVPAFVHEI